MCAYGECVNMGVYAFVCVHVSGSDVKVVTSSSYIASRLILAC